MAASCHIDPAVLHNLSLGVSGSLRKNFLLQRLGSVIFCFFQVSANICPRCRLPPHWVMPSCSRGLSQLRALLHSRQGRHSKAKGQPPGWPLKGEGQTQHSVHALISSIPLPHTHTGAAVVVDMLEVAVFWAEGENWTSFCKENFRPQFSGDHFRFIAFSLVVLPRK